MTVSCFIAHQLGSHSRMIKMVLKIAIIAAAVYGLLRLTEISIEIKRADTLFLKIE